eukprot:sb/3464929/
MTENSERKKIGDLLKELSGLDATAKASVISALLNDDQKLKSELEKSFTQNKDIPTTTPPVIKEEIQDAPPSSVTPTSPPAVTTSSAVNELHALLNTYLQEENKMKSTSNTYLQEENKMKSVTSNNSMNNTTSNGHGNNSPSMATSNEHNSLTMANSPAPLSPGGLKEEVFEPAATLEDPTATSLTDQIMKFHSAVEAMRTTSQPPPPTKAQIIEEEVILPPEWPRNNRQRKPSKNRFILPNTAAARMDGTAVPTSPTIDNNRPIIPKPGTNPATMVTDLETILNSYYNGKKEDGANGQKEEQSATTDQLPTTQLPPSTVQQQLSSIPPSTPLTPPPTTEDANLNKLGIGETCCYHGYHCCYLLPWLPCCVMQSGFPATMSLQFTLVLIPSSPLPRSATNPGPPKCNQHGHRPQPDFTRHVWRGQPPR